MVSDDDVVTNLKRDLQDGDDLAQAVSLVSDAIQRRIHRVQRSLSMLDSDPRADAVRQRLHLLLDRYEASLSRQSDTLGLIVEEYQPELGALAEELEDAEREDDGSA